MTLRLEYLDVVDKARIKLEGYQEVAERCQALADSKPIKRLTDQELKDAYYSTNVFVDSLRAVEAAAHAKQKEPEVRTVKCRFFAKTGSSAIYCATESTTDVDSQLPNGKVDHWWVGDAFEREVKV